MSNNRLNHAIRKAQELAAAPLSIVYFIQCEEFTKIGITQGLPSRLSVYRVHNPFPVKLLASFDTRHPKRDEDLLHTAFEAYRVVGEWFKLPKQIIAWIKDNRKSLTAEVLVDQIVAALSN